MQKLYQITPLGAAIVEALPDRAAARRIQRNFRRKRLCPPSAIFSPAEVVAYYRARGEKVRARATTH